MHSSHLQEISWPIFLDLLQTLRRRVGDDGLRKQDPSNGRTCPHTAFQKQRLEFMGGALIFF